MPSIRKKTAIYVAATLYVLYIAAPLSWMFLTSILPEIQLVFLGKDLTLPTSVTLAAYGALLFRTPLLRVLSNTIIYGLSVGGLVLGLGSIAAYGFVFLPVPRKRYLFTTLLFVSTVPGWAIAIPTFIYMREIGLYDTLPAIIYITTGYCMPFAIWMLSSFFRTIPPDLKESGLIDGCSPLQVLRRIILPLAAPGLAAVFIWSFLSAWGEFVWPLLLTETNAEVITVLAAAASSMGKYGANYPLISSIGVVTMLPPILLALIFQKWIVRGLTAGATKG